MARAPEQTTAWVAGVMKGKVGVLGVDVRTPRSLVVARKDYAPYVAGILAAETVTAAEVADVLQQDPGVEIIINVPGSGLWRGDAIAATQACGIAFGDMGDLMRVIGREDVRGFVRSDYAFIDRGLRQHGRVASVDREADRLYLIHRKGLPDVRMIALDPYELSGEHLREARDRYGAFDLVLLNNPNGKATASANEVAAQWGVEIHKFGPFMGRLNAP